MAKLEWTGERYVPWLKEAEIGYEHLHRYAYASQFVTGKRVLDLASGEGYGSYLLARTASSVVGIDLDSNSVQHASNKYRIDNLQFGAGSILEVPIEGKQLFDVIVCFEALEHVEDHDKLLKEVKRLLTRDGVFIASTPNKVVYSDEPQYQNPFHVHELYFDELRELVGTYFEQVQLFGQRIYATSNIWPISGREKLEFVEHLVERAAQGFILTERERKVPLYFIVVASDSKEAIAESGSNLIDVSNELIEQKNSQVANLTGERERLAHDVAQLHQALAENDAQITQLTAEQEQLAGDVRTQQGVLNAMEESLAWVLVFKYRRVRDGLFPAGSRRRRTYDILTDALNALVQARRSASR